MIRLLLVDDQSLICQGLPEKLGLKPRLYRTALVSIKCK